MTAQPTLFDTPVVFPDPPSQRHSATSRAAAESAKDRAPTDRHRILTFLRRFGGEEGRSDEEIATYLALNPSSERPRRRELELAGLIEKAGETKTVSGRRAVTWRAVA